MSPPEEEKKTIFTRQFYKKRGVEPPAIFKTLGVGFDRL